ncbi:MAG: bifunctional hydroxymethylpyrimidine kinase/phosphomethylpyrimidine kinase [Betaproteobacteria bacterium]|jgi:hydroxymethylpyrimidine/phosphomethylpyrimidine kinase|nr:bifunctional hydroxymethylpyrimidine kinase/phosphomethylpyrimidine kinase [Rhodocyclaceae bacterium]MCA3142227.1 bifunctional hydroxymethylpyrimidine kinase/phosphomethylpyrimidine kinase [Rhodocyclaceae bacterium]MCE2897220.1 bifunctional hydroxymethylpyrimidine kinase/phosphomethylpyrimidine kinase [Betaproteobacteria bacterium]
MPPQAPHSIPNVLSIAGVDPGGGAGVLADVKTFAALGAYGCGAIAALTAQNTRAVTGIVEVEPEFLRLQLDTLFSDIQIDAVKIGMLANAALITVVAEALRRHRPRFVVLDPVMVAKSGDRLLRAEAIAALKQQLLPLATVLTPNLPEAGDLLGHLVREGSEGQRAAARELHQLGARHVLVKGGHGSGDTLLDVFFDGERFTELPARRIATQNTHGTGCTLSSAIAALLPQRQHVAEAVAEARAYVLAAIAAADRLNVGTGHGPLHHFHGLWPAAPA